MVNDISDLISPAYLAENRAMHAKGRFDNRSKRAARNALLAQMLVQKYGTKDILDYGCGRDSSLSKAMCLPLREFDPCVPGKDTLPEPADLVVSFDVLEHVETDKVHTTLRFLRSLTRVAGIHLIALQPARKKYKGKDMHVTQKPEPWWLGEFDKIPWNWAVHHYQKGRHLIVRVEAYK